MNEGHDVAPAQPDRDGEPAVVMARWDAGAVPPTATGLARAVSAFATRHGMHESLRQRLELLVEEAASAASDPSPYDGSEMTVEAATDGDWLSVRLTGATRWDAARVERRLWLAQAVADRVEAGPTAGAAVTSVLMELPMAVPSPRTAALQPLAG
jgi:hypothetical protein